MEFISFCLMEYSAKTLKLDKLGGEEFSIIMSCGQHYFPEPIFMIQNEKCLYECPWIVE